MRDRTRAEGVALARQLLADVADVTARPRPRTLSIPEQERAAELAADRFACRLIALGLVGYAGLVVGVFWWIAAAPPNAVPAPPAIPQAAE